MAIRQGIGKLAAIVMVALACCAFEPSYAYAEWGAGETTVLVEIEDGVVSIIPGRLDLIRAEIQELNDTYGNVGLSMDAIGWRTDDYLQDSVIGLLKWMKTKWLDPASSVNSQLGALVGYTSSTSSETNVIGLLKWMKEKWYDPFNNLHNELQYLIGTTYSTSSETNVIGLLKWMKEKWYDPFNNLVSWIQALIGNTNATSSENNVIGLLKWMKANWSTGSSGSPSGIDYTNVLNGIQSDIEDIFGLLEYWMNNGNESDLIGNVDWATYSTKAGTLANTVSSLAPFGGALLLSETVALISSQGGLDNPSFEFDFDFGSRHEHFAIDMGYMADARPLFNFLCVLLLVLCLGSVSVRVMEMEAAT